MTLGRSGRSAGAATVARDANDSPQPGRSSNSSQERQEGRSRRVVEKRGKETKGEDLGKSKGKEVTSKNSDAIGVSSQEEKGASGESSMQTGEKDPSSLPKGKCGIQKLDENIFKPWGGSRASSDSGSESVICKGGPSNMDCGNPVLNGQEGVQCDCCSGWFHDTCQGIEIPAIRALDRFKILSWLCAECKYTIKKKDDPKKVDALEAKVEQLDSAVRKHMQLVESCFKEQEKVVADQNKKMEQNIKDCHQEKRSYADILKGTCDEVVRKVSEKVAGLPADTTGNVGPNPPGKSVQDISVVFDDFLDKEKRKLNLVVHNLPEPEGETFQERSAKDATLFTSMIKEVFKLSVAPLKSFRVGKKLQGKSRLLIVTLDGMSTKYDILKLAPQLRNSENYSNVYINPDMTQKEREQGKKLRDELVARRKAGELNITIRRGKIIHTDHGSVKTHGSHSVEPQISINVSQATNGQSAPVNDLDSTLPVHVPTENGNENESVVPTDDLPLNHAKPVDTHSQSDVRRE